ncbi:MAG: 6-bladed beta-propeller, partial [Tannerella sp.]|nr:6-bladed beta-propeller [Tannerella sp.]
MKKLIYTFAAFLLLSCAEKVSYNQLITVDFNAKYPEKELLLQDIADVEYVRLETTDTFLLGRSVRLGFCNDEYIIIADYQSSAIVIYDRKGNPVSYFSRKGQSHEEWVNISSAFYDPYRDEVFVIEIFPSKIKVYDKKGKFKRGKDLPSRTDGLTVVDFDGDNLLLCETMRSFSIEDKEPVAKTDSISYYMISKNDIAVTDSFNIKVPKKVSPAIIHSETTNGQQYVYVMLYSYPHVVKSKNGFVISEISSDTIYRLNSELQMTPYIVRTPSVGAYEYLTSLSFALDRPDFMLLRLLNMEGKDDNFLNHEKYLFYDKKSGLISDYKFVNADYPDLKNAGIDDEHQISKTGEYIYGFLQASDLLEALEAGKLKGKLKEIASQ